MRKSRQARISVRDAALRLLANREHSSFELRNKLVQRGYGQEEIEAAIQCLQQESLLSDERFAEAYVYYRKQRGYGPARIRLELKERGVESVLIDQYLDQDDPAWIEMMEYQRQKKFGGSPAQDYNAQVKQARFLQQRGFLPSQIMKIIDYS